MGRIFQTIFVICNGPSTIRGTVSLEIESLSGPQSSEVRSTSSDEKRFAKPLAKGE